MATTVNRRMLIASLPDGPLRPDNFRLDEGPVPEPGDGQVLLRTLAITIGAGQRAGLQGSASYAATPEAGRVMDGTGFARVEASNDPSVPVGALVTTMTGWQEWSVQPAAAVTTFPDGTDPATALGLLGINGLTAYFGLFEIGRPEPGETVVVSAAAGSVGHIVGQLAKLHGCRVVGVAGSDEKCRLLTSQLGFDESVNYRAEGFREAFRAATADRIGVYFDNTGGPILESALFRMRTHGRIVCCGVVSQYDTATPGPGPRGIPGLLVNNRVRMQGFIVFDFRDKYDEARTRLQGWVAEGRLSPQVTEFDGLEQAPHAFVELLGGGTVGTTVVHVAGGGGRANRR